MAANREQCSFKFFPKFHFWISAHFFFSLVFTSVETVWGVKASNYRQYFIPIENVERNFFGSLFDSLIVLLYYLRSFAQPMISGPVSASRIPRFEKSIFPSLIFLPLCGFLFPQPPVIDAQPCFHLYPSNIRIRYNESETKEKDRLDIFLTFLPF